jgi:hypothetical protein
VPNAAVSINGEQVTITTSIVRQEQQTVVFQVGDWTLLGRCEAVFVDKALLTSLPSGCRERFWWVGVQRRAVPATALNRQIKEQIRISPTVTP